MNTHLEKNPSQKKQHLARKQLRQAIGKTIILSTLTLSVALSSVSSYAQDAAQHIALPAGKLGTALNTFAAETGVVVYFDSSLTQGKNTTSLDGDFTVAAALAQLLSGSGLKAIKESDGSYRVIDSKMNDGVMVLDAVKVGDSAIEESAYGPVEGYIAKRSATGTKSDSALIETPQAISVISSDQMIAQNFQTPSQVVRYTPGVMAELYGNDSRYDWVRLRGFAVEEYLDGMALPRNEYARPRLELAAVERAELLRGPASVLYGTTPPGGLYNFVSKKPQEDHQGRVSLQFGDPEQLQISADITGSLSDKIMYRLIGLMRDGDTQVDHVENDRQFIQPSITFRPTDNTDITLMAYYYDDDSKSLQFLPIEGLLESNPNGQISRETFTGEPDYDAFNRIQKGISIDIQHEFKNGWSLSHKSRQSEVDVSLQGFRPDSFSGVWVDEAPADGVPDDYRTINRLGFGFEDNAQALTSDTHVLGSFNTGEVSHKLLAGLDYRNTKNDLQRELGIAGTLDIYNPIYGNTDIFFLPFLALDSEQELNQTGVYLQDQIKIGQTTVIMSARHDWADTDVNNRLTMTKTEVEDKDFSYRGGVIYNFDNGLAPYISYSTSFQPNTVSDQNGDPLDPTTGKQIEVGVKYQSPDQKQLITLSVYEITQNDVALTALGGGYSEQVGEVTVEGVELEAKAEVIDGLNVIASASITDSEITEDNDTTLIGNQLSTIPEKNASLWAEYTFPANVVDGLGFGLGVRYVGSHFGDKANTIEIPSHTVIDAALYYDLSALNNSLKGAKVSLNVSNVTDKAFVSSCEFACYWGEGRTVLAKISYNW